jgi:hypothetical protein
MDMPQAGYPQRRKTATRGYILGLSLKRRPNAAIMDEGIRSYINTRSELITRLLLKFQYEVSHALL